MEYLIHYPHGCLEQTTSGVFPQLYLPALIKLTQNQRLQVENNMRAGIARLRSMQHPSGGFAYWPGVWSTDPALEWRNDWGTTYAGHFMLEAEKAGYALPGDMKAAWVRFQKERAQRWTSRRYEWPGEKDAVAIEAARYAQAYRLFTLALAGQPEIGAMNRLRESRLVFDRRALDAGLGVQARRQGGRGQRAGAARPAAGLRVRRPESVHLRLAAARSRGGADGPHAAGSRCGVECVARGGVGAVVRHELVQHAVGVVRAGGGGAECGREAVQGFQLRLFSRFRRAKSNNTVAGESPLASIELPTPPMAGMPLELTNTSDRKLYVTASVRAVPRSGEEQPSANGLTLDRQLQRRGRQCRRHRQGVAGHGSHRADHGEECRRARARQPGAVAAGARRGWEIRNDRLEQVDTAGDREQDKAYRGHIWWVPGEWRRQQLRTAEYVDIRDDRVQRYFSLHSGESIFFETRLNAAYLGKYYLPGASIEAMYDAKQHARLKGQWVQVVSPQR